MYLQCDLERCLPWEPAGKMEVFFVASMWQLLWVCVPVPGIRTC